MKKILKNPIFTFVLGILFGLVGLVSAYSLLADDEGFTPNDSSWKKEDGSDITNVSGVIDELYRINNGYTNDELKLILQFSENKL